MLEREQRSSSDIVLVPGVRDGNWYVPKTLGWFRECLNGERPWTRFVGLADDDVPSQCDLNCIDC